MNTQTRILVMIIILCFASALSCVRQNVNQLAEAEKTAAGASKAVSGDVIKTAENAGKQEKKPEEETVVPPKEEGGGPQLPEKSPSGPPVTPIQGDIKMDDLVYPIYNYATNTYDKPKVGDLPSYTSMTNDPFPTVVGYYNQLLSGKQVKSSNNLGDAKGPYHAEFSVDSGGNHWSIGISETPQAGSTIINVAKG
jgi:hypothetical protein